MKKIILIEDEERARMMLADTLRAAGFEVMTASDGEEGIVTVLKEKPDLVISDVILPKLDGIGVLKNIRSDPSLAAIPVVLLTNLENPEVEAVAKSFGADILVKTELGLDDIAVYVASKLGAKG